MKIEVWINFDASDIPGGAAAILAAAGCGSDVAVIEDIPVLHRLDVKVTLDNTDERAERLLRLLEQYGQSSLVVRSEVFTEEERQSAPLLQMYNDANVWAFAGPEYGTKYDMEHACPTCGTGARQTSALYVDIIHLARIRKHRAIGCYNGEFLVDGGMKKKLIDHGVTGISFGDVYARLKNKKRTLIAREQVIPTHTLPPLSPKSELNPAGVCKTCRRGGWDATPGQEFRMYYRREDLSEMCDVNLTWEWFGPFDYKGKITGGDFSRPSVLVTPKVMNIFREAGVTTFEWTPIFLDE